MVELWDELDILKGMYAKLSTQIAEFETKMREEKQKSDEEYEKGSNDKFIQEYIALCKRWNRCLCLSDGSGYGLFLRLLPKKLGDYSVDFCSWVESLCS